MYTQGVGFPLSTCHGLAMLAHGREEGEGLKMEGRGGERLKMEGRGGEEGGERIIETVINVCTLHCG